MKKYLSVFSIALAAVALASCGGDDPAGEDDNKGEENNTIKIENFEKYKKIDGVRDLALIYQGARHRIDWTENDFEPYVTHRFVGGAKEEWLFDGYLFLEFTTEAGANGVRFSDGGNQGNAKREDYEWYLDRLFERGKSLDALDKVIGKKKKTLGDPGFRHKIALTTLVPIFDQTDWGELDGKTMSFRREADRQTVAKWFIDRLVERFHAGGYENLDLYGIYMLCENNYHIIDLSKAIAKHVKAKGLEYLWIPYWQAGGTADWKSLGFDIAYQQPNQFFDEKIPDSRLDDAIEYARQHKMALEFECDERALSQSTTTHRNRMLAYMDYFDKHGVWYDTPIAYYTGNHLLLDFVHQPSTLNATISDRLCRYIVARRMASEK